MRVLVTGGAGFIGSHITEHLLREGNEVEALDNLSTGKVENLSDCRGDKRFSFRNGDIRETRIVDKCVKSVDAIIHLAAMTTQSDPSGSVELTDVNVTGTVNLLRAAQHNDVQRFILASSAAVYGESSRLPLREGSRTSALSQYGASKIAAEQYCHSFRKTCGLKTTILRFFNVYGPRQLPTGDGAVIPQFLNRIKQDRPPEIFGDGRQTRDFVHVTDVAECTARILNNDLEETFNVGSGTPVTINQLADMLLNLSRSTQRPLHKSAKKGEIRNSCASTLKIRKYLAFRPRITLQEGLRQLAVK